MKVLILYYLTGVGLFGITTAPAYARTVRKDFLLQRQHQQPQLNPNNNNNNNDNNNGNKKPFMKQPVEALVATLKSEVNAAHTLETTLEPPHTTKSAITLGEKRPARQNSKFLQRPEDANVASQHTANNDELELFENTTESPKRKLTTAASTNNGNATATDHDRLTAKLRKQKQQQVANETLGKAEQSAAEVVSGPVEGANGAEEGTNKNTKKQRRRKEKLEQKHPKQQKQILRNKKVLNKNENNIEEVNANNIGNKVNATKKKSVDKRKQQQLKVQNKQKKSATTAPKTNRKANTANTGLNKNGNTHSKRTAKKSQPLRRPSPKNRQTRRRNRFNAPLKRRPNKKPN